MSATPEQLAKTALGRELTAEDSSALADLMTIRSLADGDWLYTEGESGDALHAVLEGKLEVIRKTGAGEAATLGIIRAGELAGELAFIDGNVHSTGLRALSNARVLKLSHADFETLVDTNPRLAYKIMRAVARSAHQLMRRLNNDFVELSNYIFKQHGRY